MHTHTPYATALGCLQDPSLLMVHQNSCRFVEYLLIYVNLSVKFLILIKNKGRGFSVVVKQYTGAEIGTNIQFCF